MAIVSDGASVVPGQYLAPLRDPQGHYILGPGTTITKVEVEDQAILVISATLVGSVKVVRDENEPKDDTDEQKSPAYVISVAPRKELPLVLPKQGDVVLVRITRLNQKQAFCEILSVEDNKNVLLDSGIGAVGTTAHHSRQSCSGRFGRDIQGHNTYAGCAVDGQRQGANSGLFPAWRYCSRDDFLVGRRFQLLLDYCSQRFGSGIRSW